MYLITVVCGFFFHTHYSVRLFRSVLKFSKLKLQRITKNAMIKRSSSVQVM